MISFCISFVRSQYSIPEGGLNAGDVFGYNVQFPNDQGSWEEVSSASEEESSGGGVFDLTSSVPDNMLVYCLDADEQPHFLSAITTNGDGFSEEGLDSYTTSETALPEELGEGSGGGKLVLPFQPNYLYTGIREGDRNELVAAFADPANYEGRDTPYNIVTSGATKGVLSLLATGLMATAATLVAVF